MCSRPFRPVGLPIYVARPRRLHSFASQLARRYPLQLCLDHSHRPVLAPPTLAALPSTRAIETHSLPALTHVLQPISTSRFAHLCRSRPRGSVRSLLPLQLYLLCL